MAAVTLTTLRSRVRERADMVNSTFLTDTADSMDALINEAAQELHELLVLNYGEDYAVASASTSTVAGTSAYALPADFMKLLGVDLVMGADEVYDLQRFNFKERNVYRGASVWGGLSLPRYHVEGSNVRLYPTPSGTYNLTFWYVPAIALLVDGTDEVDFPNGWERYLVLLAAIKALHKEETDTRDLERELGAMKMQLIAVTESRDAGTPKQAVDQEIVDNQAYWGGYLP